MEITLTKLRQQKGLRTSEAARELDIDPSYLYYLEIGKRSPSFRMAKRMAEYYSVTLETIALLCDISDSNSDE